MDRPLLNLFKGNSQGVWIYIGYSNVFKKTDYLTKKHTDILKFG